MVATLSNSWKQHFLFLPLNDEGNKNLKGFEEALSSEKPTLYKIAALTKDPDTIIMASDGRNGICIFHSTRDFGGSLVRPLHKLAARFGLGTNAVPLILNEDSLTQTCELATPQTDRIMNCTTKDELENLLTPRGNSSNITFEGSATLNVDSIDPFDFILAAISAAKTHADGQSDIVSFCFAHDIAVGVSHEFAHRVAN